ncbi:omptin family outer membrane protease [Oceanispirochaeta crateris]|uniref:Omptin family outer membrane protease n=1 Tax=Oceanispirochaeta crateris TaxID=2518645 RepID=A0A5C1QM04_9SPIO|nr:omptin family outer membrane protease [Oceanispirochaeta crateris]QEN08010.1 omptin family outer membrane protease [Oceanispirochaeta crateris]
MRRHLLYILFFCSLSVPLSALQAKPGALLSPNSNAGLSLSPFLSYMTGHSNELVYGSSSGPYPYLSRLHWEIQPAVISGVSASVNIGNVLFFNIAAGSSLNSPTGEMTDYDWDSEYFSTTDTDWTHYSLSTIYLTQSLLVDYNTAVRVYRTQRNSLDLLGGFKLIQWGWTDSIKEMNYYGEDIFTYVGTNGIDYDIEYRIPYLGVGFSLQEGPLFFNLTLLYSWMVSVDDHDFHKLRGLHFYDYFTGGFYYGYSATTRWHWTEAFSLAFSFDYDYVPELQGDTLVYSDSGNLLAYYPGGAGVSYAAASFSLNLEYRY